MSSPSIILVVVEDEVVRDHVATAIAATGHTPLLAANASEGLELLDGRNPDTLAAVVLGASSLRFPLANAPVVVIVRDRLEEIASSSKGLHVVRYADGLRPLIRALEQAAAARASATRIARGSERIDKSRTPIDLHAFATAKLRQFLGETRATAALAKMTIGLPDGLIVTTKDLHTAAQRLRELGELEASIASLLSGEAVLLDSDRTLRS